MSNPNNPQHNQHIKEFAECVEDAVQQIQIYYDGILLNQNEIIENLIQRVEKLEQNAHIKRSLFEVDVVATKESLRKLKETIMGIFR